MADDTQGAQANWLVEPGASAHSFDLNSERYEFIRESMAKNGVIAHTNGIRGTREETIESSREGPYEVGGQVLFNPSPANLDLWLPRILGANESTDTFALAETLPEFGMLFDRAPGLTSDLGTFEYQDCKVNRGTFRGGEGRPFMELELDIFGKDEVVGTAWPGTPPSLSTDANAHPMLFSESDSGITINGVVTEVMDIEVTIDNVLERRFGNSLTATSITPQMRNILVNATVPFNNANRTLYGQSFSGAACTIVFTGTGILAGTSTTFTIGRLQSPDRTPVVQGKQKNTLQIQGIARAVTSTASLVVTHDSVVT